MKWLLINPRPDGFRVMGKYEKVMVPFAPMGLAYLGAALKRAGAEVSVFDGFAAGGESLAERLEAFRPDVVGLTCLTPVVPALTRLVPEIRAALPGVRVVLGNVHASLFPEDLLREGLADVVVRGEGESAVVGLHRAFSENRALPDIPGIAFLRDGKPFLTEPSRPVMDLDSLAEPAWELFDLSRYPAPPLFAFNKRLLPVLASRGCPYHCYFCAQNVTSPVLRKRDPVRVADEIQRIHRETGVDLFWFSDAIFPLAKKDAEVFCGEMRARGLHRSIRWITETRVDLVDRELFRLMRKAGLFMVLFGLESGDAEVLARIKPGATPGAGKRAVAAARAEGVLTLGLFMLGLPGETRATVKRTIRFARSIGLDFAKFNRAVPYPGSRFYEDVASRGAPLDWSLFTTGHEPGGSGGQAAFVPEGLDPGELTRLHRNAYFSFYVRPGLVIRHLVRRNVSLSNMIKGGSLVVRNRLAGLRGQ